MVTEQEQRDISGETDRQLVSRIVAGRDESAFGEIVRRHGPLVMGVCRRVLGEADEVDDAFQATFLVLIHNARKIRRRKSLSCWLHGVAYRISLRVAKGKIRHMEPLAEDQAEQRPTMLEHIAHRHDQHMVDEELSRLPEKDRVSLTLRYLENRSNSEIARTLDISVSAVEGRLKRAKDRLRRQLMRRGVTLGVFLGVLADSHVELLAIEPLIGRAVELGLMGAAGELPDSSVASELAASEIGEMAMTVKQVVTVAAVTVLTAGLGLVGLSGSVVGQESTAEIVVQAATADDPFGDVEVKVVPTRPTLVVQDTVRQAKPAVVASARLAQARRISAALEDEILLEFNDAPLSEVVDYLKTARAIPIVIDRRGLEDIGLATDAPVTCSFSGISLRSALALVLDEMDLDYVIRNEVLMITSKEVAEVQLDPRVYNTEVTGIADLDQLIELITAMIAPDSWEEVGGTARIGTYGNALVIAQTDQIHNQISDFLEKLRAAKSK